MKIPPLPESGHNSFWNPCAVPLRPASAFTVRRPRLATWFHSFPFGPPYSYKLKSYYAEHLVPHYTIFLSGTELTLHLLI